VLNGKIDTNAQKQVLLTAMRGGRLRIDSARNTKNGNANGGLNEGVQATMKRKLQIPANATLKKILGLQVLMD
jgi:hypothetical protein